MQEKGGNVRTIIHKIKLTYAKKIVYYFFKGIHFPLNAYLNDFSDQYTQANKKKKNHLKILRLHLVTDNSDWSSGIKHPLLVMHAPCKTRNNTKMNKTKIKIPFPRLQSQSATVTNYNLTVDCALKMVLKLFSSSHSSNPSSKLHKLFLKCL